MVIPGEGTECDLCMTWCSDSFKFQSASSPIRPKIGRLPTAQMDVYPPCLCWLPQITYTKLYFPLFHSFLEVTTSWMILKNFYHRKYNMIQIVGSLYWATFEIIGWLVEYTYLLLKSLSSLNVTHFLWIKHWRILDGFNIIIWNLIKMISWIMFPY